MMGKNSVKSKMRKAIFSLFFAVMGVFGLFSGAIVSDTPVFADPVEQTTTNTENTTTTVSTNNSCQDSLGAIGWLVCPTTGKIAEAVDWLYDKIEDILVINPVEATDGSPIYEVWKYVKGITNIVFIIFLLVVIYSQITGLGISNYGLKKTLPKLIVAAILVNLSFLICSLAVDVSNIVGSGLRGVFTSVEETVVANMPGMDPNSPQTNLSYAEMYASMAGGAALAIGGAVIAFETGAIWMLIPVVLGAIVAVVTGLITIALRQAVVALLIMVAPLAIVAYILPNVDEWFKKWKKLLTQMLIFYPMFSLLFGASSLAGFAIIASAQDGFGLLLGTAVQIFPLFFSWSLMKMSGTFLGDINARLRGLSTTPLAANRAWADSRRQLSRQKHLASTKAFTPSARLMQFMSNRRVAREAELSENADLVKKRGLAYYAQSHYRSDGTISKKGKEAYRQQAEGANYDNIVLRDKNNMNKGYGSIRGAARSRAEQAELDKLDQLNVKAFDTLKIEQARAEKIDYDNAKGFYNRTEAAINAGMDWENGFTVDQNGNRVAKPNYKFHFNPSDLQNSEALARYNAISQIMEGKNDDIQFAAAASAQSYDTHAKAVAAKYQRYFDLTPASKDLEYRLTQLTKLPDAANYIDAIVSGLSIINKRGDTDVVKAQLDNILNSANGVQLGTHASQSLANFLMFEVKDSDPWLRRFGKYINLETARAFNKNDRQEMNITYDEYIKGYHDEPDPANPGQTKRMYAKKSMAVLMEGTPLDNVERTAFSNLDESLMKAYTDTNGNFDYDGYIGKREEIQKSIASSFISASTKYLTGSEQLKSAVAFLTGYSYGQVKDPNTGEILLDEKGKPVYSWQAIWDDNGDSHFSGHKEETMKYFRGKTEQYIKDLTPNQVLGMRSDYRDPLMEHLTSMFLEESPERDEYVAELADIQTRYGDLLPDEAKRKRAADERSLKMKMAGKQIRKILGNTGKLEQIYATRKSGAANNAKDWLREWVNLDNIEALREEVNERNREKRAQYEQERRQSDVTDDDVTRAQVYTDEDIERFEAEVDMLNERYGDEEVEDFFAKTKEQLENWFGKDAYLVWRYDKYYEDNQYADNDELYGWLKTTLANLDNYPGQ